MATTELCTEYRTRKNTKCTACTEHRHTTEQDKICFLSVQRVQNTGTEQNKTKYVSLVYSRYRTQAQNRTRQNIFPKCTAGTEHRHTTEQDKIFFLSVQRVQNTSTQQNKTKYVSKVYSVYRTQPENRTIKMSMSKFCTEQERGTEQGNPMLGVYSVYSSESTEQEKNQFIVH